MGPRQNNWSRKLNWFCFASYRYIVNLGAGLCIYIVIYLVLIATGRSLNGKTLTQLRDHEELVWVCNITPR